MGKALKGTPVGFTLIEILVVIAITAVVGIFLVSIFINTLRGSNKSQILAAIKQNGQAVLENMDKIIRSADAVICTSSYLNPGPTLVINKNGVYTRFRFISPTLSENGYITQDMPEKPAYGTKDDWQVFIDNVCINPSVSPTILTDTNPQSGVSVTTGSFSKDPPSGFKTSVTVKFTLDHGVKAPAAVAGQIDPIEFATSVGLR